MDEYVTDDPAATLRVPPAGSCVAWKHVICLEETSPTKPLSCQLSARRTYSQFPVPSMEGKMSEAGS